MICAHLQLVPDAPASARTRLSAPPARLERGARAFTLIEMLVVLGIVGVLAAMTLPSFKKGGKGNITESATRQLLDDLSYARLKAMGNRTKVYVVFSPDLGWFTGGAALSGSDINFLTTNVAANNVVGGQLTSYALFSPRSVGDQPGQSTPLYLTDWRSLPDGAFVPEGAFRQAGIFHNLTSPPFAANSPLNNQLIPADDVAGAAMLRLPFIAFDELGRLFGRNTNITISLVEGSIMHPKDATGQTNIVTATDAVTTAPSIPSGGIAAGIEYLVVGPIGSQVRYPPAGAGSTIYTVGQTFLGLTPPPANRRNFTLVSGSPRVVQLYGVRIDWSTGRAKAVKPELQ